MGKGYEEGLWGRDLERIFEDIKGDMWALGKVVRKRCEDRF